MLNEDSGRAPCMISIQSSMSSLNMAILCIVLTVAHVRSCMCRGVQHAIRCPPSRFQAAQARVAPEPVADKIMELHGTPFYTTPIPIKVQISLKQALFGPHFGMGGGIEGGILEYLGCL